MPLDPSIILKNLTPGDNQTQQANIASTNTTTKTNQLLQSYQVQSAALQNQQAAAMNPLAVQNQKYSNAVNAMTIAAQVSSGVHDQPSLDAAHQTLQGLGVDSYAQLPKTWDPSTGPAQAAQAYTTALRLKGQYMQMQELSLKQAGVHNGAVTAQTGAQGTVPTVAPDGITLQMPGGDSSAPTPSGGTLANPSIPAPPAAGQMQSQMDGGPAPSPPPVQSSNLPPPAGQGSMNMPASAASSPAMMALAGSGSALPQPDTPNINPAYSAAVGAQPAGAVAPTPSAATPLQGQSAAVAPAPAQNSLVNPATVQAKINAINNDPTLSVAGKNAALDRYKATPEYENYQTSLREIRNEQGAIGTGAGTDFNKMKTDNDAAGPAISTIQQAMSEAQQFPSGTGANARLAAGKVVQSIAGTLGIPVGNLAEQNGSQEAFNKAMLQMTMGSLQQTGEKSNASLNAFQSGLPSSVTTKNGLQQVAAGLIGTQQFKQAQFIAANAMNANGQSVKNFNFQGNISPMAFVFNNMTPANQTIFAHNLSQQPNGQSEIKNLRSQIVWARQQPWAQQFNFAPQVAQ